MRSFWTSRETAMEMLYAALLCTPAWTRKTKKVEAIPCCLCGPTSRGISSTVNIGSDSRRSSVHFGVCTVRRCWVACARKAQNSAIRFTPLGVRCAVCGGHCDESRQVNRTGRNVAGPLKAPGPVEHEVFVVWLPLVDASDGRLQRCSARRSMLVLALVYVCMKSFASTDILRRHRNPRHGEHEVIVICEPLVHTCDGRLHRRPQHCVDCWFQVAARASGTRTIDVLAHVAQRATELQ